MPPIEATEVPRESVNTESAGIQAAGLFSDGNQTWNQARDANKTGDSAAANDMLDGFSIDFGGQSNDAQAISNPANPESRDSGLNASTNDSYARSDRSDEKPSARTESDDTKPRDPNYVDPMEAFAQRREEDDRRIGEACTGSPWAPGTRPEGTAGVLSLAIDIQSALTCNRVRNEVEQRNRNGRQ